MTRNFTRTDRQTQQEQKARKDTFGSITSRACYTIEPNHFHLHEKQCLLAFSVAFNFFLFADALLVVCDICIESHVRRDSTRCHKRILEIQWDSEGEYPSNRNFSKDFCNTVGSKCQDKRCRSYIIAFFFHRLFYSIYHPILCHTCITFEQ